MKRYEKELIEALEENNAKLIEILSSKEYVLGCQIYKVCSLIKKCNLHGLFLILKHKIAEFVVYKRYIRLQNRTCENLGNSYKSNLEFANKKIAVYTCVVGEYDHVKKPIYKTPGVDYYLFSDIIEAEGWKHVNIPEYILAYDNPFLINRYIKMHPHELFPDYDYTIYVDGKVQIVSEIASLIQYIKEETGIAMHRHIQRDDIYDEAATCIWYRKGNKKKLKEQIKRYRLEGFPQNYGMLEATIIVCDICNKQAERILEEWWQEFFDSASFRDQIALPYILWKQDIKICDVGNLGCNLYVNPKFIVGVLHK